jgi:hypothetical protein
MTMFRFGKRPAPARPLLSKPLQAVAGKPPERKTAAPLALPGDSDGRLRRKRQVVEDNRLL